MPQLSQLSQVYLSQFLWLAVALAFVFFVIARGMVPKIQATVDAREQRIANDLKAAQAARATADATEAAWRERMDSARSEAARLAETARAESARETEAKMKAATDQVNAKVEAAQSSIRAALISAHGEIEQLAAEAAREMVRRVAGLTVDSDDATAAVKAEFNG